MNRYLMKAKLRSSSEIVTIDTSRTVRSTPSLTVHPIKGMTGSVAALLKPGVDIPVRKLAILCDLSSKSDAGAVRKKSVDWPGDILYDPDSMDCIGAMTPSAAYETNLGELMSPVFRRRKNAGISYRSLYRVALNLAKTLSDIHARGCMVGSIDTRNILVSDTSLVFLTGSMFFQLVDPKNGEVLHASVTPGENNAPELPEFMRSQTPLTADQDNFWLAVVLFRLLSDGNNPFSRDLSDKSVPGQSVFSQSVRELFNRCFGDGHANVQVRPTTTEWIDALTAALNELQKCNTNPLHYFDPDADECPWCALSRRMGGADSFPAGEPIYPEPLAPAAEKKRGSSGLSIVAGALFLILAIGAVAYLNFGWVTRMSRDQTRAMQTLSSVERMDPSQVTFLQLVQIAEQANRDAGSEFFVAQAMPMGKIFWSFANHPAEMLKRIHACQIVSRATAKLVEVKASVNRYVHEDLTEAQAISVRGQLLSECESIQKDSMDARSADPALAGAWIVGIRAYNLAGQVDNARALTVKALATCPNKDAIKDLR